MSKLSANSNYEQGSAHYVTAQNLEDANGDQETIDLYYGKAASSLWVALSLGHLQAPYSLSSIFIEGVGVKQDDYIAKLFFGVAQELQDPKCDREINKDIIIPDSMREAILNLTELVKETNSKIPGDLELEIEAINIQMHKFSDSVALPHLPKDYSLFCFFMGERDGSPIKEEPEPLRTAEYELNKFNTEVKPIFDKFDAMNQQQNDLALAGNQNPDDSSCCCIIL